MTGDYDTGGCPVCGRPHVCPVCGGPSDFGAIACAGCVHHVETRYLPGGTRRHAVCLTDGCGWVYEVAATDPRLEAAVVSHRTDPRTRPDPATDPPPHRSRS